MKAEGSDGETYTPTNELIDALPDPYLIYDDNEEECDESDQQFSYFDEEIDTKRKTKQNNF